MKKLERELKYLISKEDYESAVKDSESVEQVNYYFLPTENADKHTLRIRRRLGCYELTFKVRIETMYDMNTAEEYSEEISESLAKCCIEGGISAQTLNTVLGTAIAPDIRFEYVGLLTTYRARYPSEEGFVLEFDKNDYLGVTDYEVECECSSEEETHRARQYIKSRFEVKGALPKTMRFFMELIKS